MILKTVTLLFLVLSSYQSLAANKDTMEAMTSQAVDEAISNADQKLAEVTEFTDDDGELKELIKKCDATNGTFDPKSIGADNSLVDRLCQASPPSAENLSIAHPDSKQACEFREITPCSIKFVKQIQFSFKADVNEQFIFRSNHSSWWGIGIGIGVNSHYRKAAKEIAATEFGTIAISCRPVSLLAIQPRWICAAGHSTLWWVDQYAYGFAFRTYDVAKPDGIQKLWVELKGENGQIKHYWTDRDDEGLYQAAEKAKFLKQFLKEVGVPQ